VTHRERVIHFLKGGETDRLCLMPITMMFAADQVGAKYGRYAIDHEVMVRAQLATAEKYDFDHVSGITETREAPDCGAAVRYFEDQPYALDEENSRLAEKSNLQKLVVPDPLGGNLMHDRINGLAKMKQLAGSERIVEGWVEGACGAGADLRGINRLMLDFYDDPDFVHSLFSFVLEVGLRFARAQVRAGADILGIGDPAASLVGPAIYREFVWPYEKRLVDGIHDAGGLVRLHICGDTRPILKEMGALGCDLVDIDSAVPLSLAREMMGPRQAIAGGLDPVRELCNGTPESVTAAVARCHQQAGPRYVVAAGCEVPRETPPANILALGEYARRAA